MYHAASWYNLLYTYLHMRMHPETGTLVLSQYILLDPPLLFFVMTSTFCTVKFVNCRDE